MRSNVILCVLNRIFPVRDEEGNSALPKEENYYSHELRKTFKGVQANEAPVKSLIQKSHDLGNDVTEIIYLCSNKCFERAIPIATARNLKAFETYDGERISVEEFFVERISEFCRECGAHIPAFNPLPYSPSRPADCITTLNEYLDETYELSIDITGGRRDAVILQTLAIQLLKMKSIHNAIGDVVYSSFSDKEIIPQNATFSLIDLIEAVGAFTNYGRADRLSSYFEKQKLVTDETLDLCKKMEAFSDALAVCQVGDIDDKTKSVQETMQAVDAALRKRSSYYKLATDALNVLDDPDGWICELTLEEALNNVRQSDMPINVDVESQEELRANLAQAQWDYTIFRGELLLHSLLPTMKEKFIPEAKDNDSLIINTIIWCVRHQMIQQAMCIYREKIAECLLHFGFFDSTDHFNNLGADKQHEIAIDLATKCIVSDGSKHPFKTLSFYEKPKNGFDYNDFFTINREKSDQLHVVMAWYKYLHGTRNKIMHVDSSQDTFPYKFACAFLGKPIGGEINVHELKADILHALRCIKEPQRFDVNAWKDAFAKASASDTSGSHSVPQALYSSKTESSTGLVGNLMELQLLLVKFAGNAKEVVFDDFNKWCNQEEKKQLSKDALGLDKEKPFYRGLCLKYSKQFSWRKDGETLYLKFR